jgi:hypothetical protein
LAAFSQFIPAKLIKKWQDRSGALRGFVGQVKKKAAVQTELHGDIFGKGFWYQHGAQCILIAKNVN